MTAAVDFAELFDPDFLAAVQHLKIVARRVPRAGRLAEQRSQDLGSGIEFRDFRPYAAGDDFRAIDWNIYRRLGRVFLRLFEELEDLSLYLMPDVSTSMSSDGLVRMRATLRTTMALATVSLSQHDRVGVFPFANKLISPRPPAAGRGRIMALAKHLATLESHGDTDMVASLVEFAKQRLRPGLLVVLSDYFDPGGIETVIEALKRQRHKLLLIQIARDEDRDPRFRGDYRLVDCESGQAQDVSVDEAVLGRYRESYDRFQAKIIAFAKSHPAGFLRLNADQEVVPQLANLFETGSYVT